MIEAEDIAQTARRIAPYVRVTPVIETGVPGAALPTVFKLEFLQHTASFKPRGAFANLAGRELPAAGVAAASGGNHGAAVAYAAQKLGTKAHIFVPLLTTPAKVARIRSYGAELVQGGVNYQAALENCDRFAAETGALRVHAYDSRATLLGQGTLARELEEQAPGLDALLVAVGGGGLIGGIAAWYAGAIRIVAVEPEGAPTLFEAFNAGLPVDAPAGGIAADSLAPRRVGELMFPIARRHVERVLLVSDDAIRRAQQTMWDALRVVAEPGGSAAFAALQSHAYQPAAGERIGIVVSGGNTTAVNFD